MMILAYTMTTDHNDDSLADINVGVLVENDVFCHILSDLSGIVNVETLKDMAIHLREYTIRSIWHCKCRV